MLSMSDLAYLVPRWTRSFVPVWRRFVQAWDDISDVGEQQTGTSLDSLTLILSFCPPTAASSLINKRIAEIEARVEGGESVEGLYLTHLLASNKLSRAEIYTCITEMLLGGVDTVRSRISEIFLRSRTDPGVQTTSAQSSNPWLTPEGRLRRPEFWLVFRPGWSPNLEKKSAFHVFIY